MAVQIDLDEECSTLLARNEGEKIPVNFRSNVWTPTEKKYPLDSAERLLCSLAKQIIDIKEIAKEKQIIVHTNNLSLIRWKKNLVQDAKMAHRSRDEQWVSILDALQLSFITKHNEKGAGRLTFIPKGLQQNITIYTDGFQTEEDGLIWAFTAKLKGELLYQEKGMALGSVQKTKVMVLQKALEWAVKDLKK